MNIRRHVLAGVAACGILVGTSTPGFCDIGPGDLKEVIEDAWNDALDSLCAWLLQPLDALEEMTPMPFPEPPAAYPDSLPTAPDSGIAATEESIADQQARVKAAEHVVTLATQAQAAQEAQLQMLQALNITPPVSVAAGQQIGNQVASVGVTAQTAQAQLLATQVGLQAAEIMQREQARAAELEAIQAFANNYDGQPVRPQVEYIRLFGQR